MSRGEILYDVIGGISDIYVTEAALPFKRRSNGVSARRMLLIAATVTMSLVMLFAVFANFGKNTATAPDDKTNYPINDIVIPDGAEIWMKTREDINLFSDSPLLIIRKYGEEDFTVITLKKPEYKRLTDIGDFADVKEGMDPGYEVWICDGNGVVFSPYLKLSAGNLGYGEIFDYSPEVILPESYTNTINRIIDKYFNE